MLILIRMVIDIQFVFIILQRFREESIQCFNEGKPNFAFRNYEEYRLPVSGFIILKFQFLKIAGVQMSPEFRGFRRIDISESF